jgi:phosphomannomutase
MLAAIHVLASLGGQDKPLSELLSQYSKYVASGEINSEVADQAGAMAKVRKVFAERPGTSAEDLDGLTISAPDWWFNLRPSNTEPLLRLNVEAEDDATLAKVTDEVLDIVRNDAEP